MILCRAPVSAPICPPSPLYFPQEEGALCRARRESEPTAALSAGDRKVGGRESTVTGESCSLLRDARRSSAKEGRKRSSSRGEEGRVKDEGEGWGSAGRRRVHSFNSRSLVSQETGYKAVVHATRYIDDGDKIQ